MIDAVPPPPGAVGVYLHLPFCRSRCSYCDFPVVIGHEQRRSEYVDALARELALFQRVLPDDADSVYFGGGTPSRAEAGQIARLLRAVRSRFSLSSDAEVTLECNPEDVSADKLRSWVEAGVNRVSIGLQSLATDVLLRAGRAHDGALGERAVDLALAQAGLSVGVDLICGLPGERLEGWTETVERVAALGPGHVSLYLLDTDKQSILAARLRRGTLVAPDDELLAHAYLESCRALESRGLVQYEISSFARRGCESRHNLKYWTDGWFGGFGLGAHAYFDGARRANHGDLERYLAALAADRDPLAHLDPWNSRRRLEEALILGLRLRRGVDLQALGRRYGVDLLSAHAALWTRTARDGLLHRLGTRVRLTRRGQLFSNELFQEVLGEFDSGEGAPVPGASPGAGRGG